MENNNANQNKVVRLMIDAVSRGNEETGWVGWKVMMAWSANELHKLPCI